MNLRKLRAKYTRIQPHSSVGSIHSRYDYPARHKAAKMRLSNAESPQKLSNATIECCEWATGAKMRSYARTRGRGGVGECGEETLPKCDPRMLRLGKSCQNVTVECGVCETCKNVIVSENGAPGRRGREEKLLNATVECCNWANVAKIRPSNAESERKLQKCDRMREQGARVGWKRGKATKMRL